MHLKKTSTNLKKGFRMRKIGLLCIVVLALSSSFADSSRKNAIGLGLGLDYGGIGVKYVFTPIDHLGLFAGLGTNLNGLGYNVGIKGDIFTNDSTNTMRLYGHIMYGYNTVTLVSGASEYNKTFYGFTPGIGLGIRFGQRKSHGLDFALNFPIRGQDVTDQLDKMKADPRISTVSDLMPVAFSFGYTWEF